MKTTILILTIALLGLFMPAKAQTDVPPSGIVVVYKQFPAVQSTSLVCKDITLEQSSCVVDETARMFSESGSNNSSEAKSTDEATDISQSQRKNLTLVSAMPVQQ